MNELNEKLERALFASMTETLADASRVVRLTDAENDAQIVIRPTLGELRNLEARLVDVVQALRLVIGSRVLLGEDGGR